MARLLVDLNDDGLHEIAVPSSFDTDGPFEVCLRNHGEAIHVHLNLDDELSSVAQLAETNQYVGPHSQRSVPIETHPVSTTVTGRLKIVTGYGAKSTYTTVQLSPPGTVRNHVTVDESLAKPQRREPEPSTPSEQIAERLPDAVSVSSLGAAAAMLVVVLAAVLTGNPTVVLGSLAVTGLIAAFVVINRR